MPAKTEERAVSDYVMVPRELVDAVKELLTLERFVPSYQCSPEKAGPGNRLRDAFDMLAASPQPVPGVTEPGEAYWKARELLATAYEKHGDKTEAALIREERSHYPAVVAIAELFMHPTVPGDAELRGIWNEELEKLPQEQESVEPAVLAAMRRVATGYDPTDHYRVSAAEAEETTNHIRAAVIEECARVADAAKTCGCGRADCYSDRIPEAIANDIRALLNSPPSEAQKDTGCIECDLGHKAVGGIHNIPTEHIGIICTRKEGT